MRGVFSNTTLKAMALRGRTPTKCACSMMSRETFCVLLVKNTVVPSTRGITPFFKIRKNFSASCGACTSVVRIASTPRRQVIMMTNRMAAKRQRQPAALGNLQEIGEEETRCRRR